ncbi:MAG: hypothetical protein LAN62_06570 [Acidobacteriia bacterium]|nr:hypothetical protein [Terriglobia bacterium]
MRHKKLSVFLAVLVSLALGVLAAAWQTAPPQSDTGGGQSSAQSEPSAQPYSPSTQPGSPQSSEQGATAGGEMPKTASPLPLIALLGLTSLGAGAAAHRLSKRYC